MKYLPVITFLVLLIFNTCDVEKEEVKTKELDITLKSTSAVTPTTIKSFVVYPNPFINSLFIYQSGYDNVKLFISRSDGAEKIYELENSKLIELDFSNEESGAYLVEGVFDGEFYREYVIKE